MAVQKKKSSKSRRGSRRSHDHLKIPVLCVDKETGTIKLYHHVANKKLFNKKEKNSKK